MGLAAFIADGSTLPRLSGTSDKPLPGDNIIPFKSPESLQIKIDLPYRGKVTGMGIPHGITLIVGGGYHGKSTLLQAIELGIYNHIPGDGREFCVANKQTIKVRSYSGRYVERVDISTFIKNLPAGQDTTVFSTDNASGSTSQAASIQESIEIGARVLLMDEDTCATNFMIRDEKMQQLVKKNDEPITTFIDKAQQLFKENNISSILVLGGAGDYFDISNKVIQMKKYIPYNVTKQALSIAMQSPVERKHEDEGYPITPKQRVLITKSIDPFNSHHKQSVYAKEVDRIYFGKNIIDLQDVEQLQELSQTKAIMHAILKIMQDGDTNRPLQQLINDFISKLQQQGLDMLSEKISGHFAEFRGLELACAINRLRGVKMQ